MNTYPSVVDVYTRPSVNVYTPPATEYSSAYPAETAAPAEANSSEAEINVRVPTDAAVWVEGRLTQQRGSLRHFVSPPLSDGDYTYSVRASWTSANGPVDMTRQVNVHAGDRVTVDFLAPRNATTDQAPIYNQNQVQQTIRTAPSADQPIP